MDYLYKGNICCDLIIVFDGWLCSLETDYKECIGKNLITFEMAEMIIKFCKGDYA